MKRLLVLLFVETTVTTIAFSAHAMGEHPNQTYIVSIGDSISAGFLAATQASQSKDEASDVQRRGDEDDPEPPPPYLWKDLRIAYLLESKTKWAWTTGIKPHSIASRLQEWVNSQSKSNKPFYLRKLNMAETGSRSEHLPRQARLAIKRITKAGGDSISLVTVLFGGNDACKDAEITPADIQFLKNNFRKTLNIIGEGHGMMMSKEPVRVFVSGLPNIPLLGRPEILNHKTIYGLSCKRVRENLFNNCINLLKWKTPAEMQERVDRVVLINNAIFAVTEEFKSDQRLSIFYDDSFFIAPIDGTMLSVDCFHPGKKGQIKMANQMWNKMPWFH